MKRLVIFALAMLVSACTVQQMSNPVINQIPRNSIAPNSSLLISVRYYDDWEFDRYTSVKLASYFKVQSESANRIGLVQEEMWELGLPLTRESRYKLKLHIFKEVGHSTQGILGAITLGLVPVKDTVRYSAIAILYDHDRPVRKYSYQATEDTWVSLYALFYAHENNMKNENIPRHFVKNLIQDLGDINLEKTIEPRAI